MNEYRRGVRLTLDDFSKVHISNAPEQVTPLELSLEGIRIQTPIALKPNTDIDLFLFNKTLRTKARVRWVKTAVEDDNLYEVGLQMEYLDFSILEYVVRQNAKNSKDTQVLVLTPVEFSAESLDVYLQLTNLGIQSTISPEEVSNYLNQQEWDLLLLDVDLIDNTQLLEDLRSRQEFSFMPIVLLTQTITKEIIKLRSSHMFLEILTKPVEAHDLLRRIVTLMEQTARYLAMESNRKQVEKELANVQQSMQSQNQEMMNMLSQVMQQSESMGQIIQLQEALSDLNSVSEVIHFAQQWAFQNFDVKTNIWDCSHEPFLPLGDQPEPHFKLSPHQRVALIQRLFNRRTNILLDDLVLIRKNNFVLEVVSETTQKDIIDSLTFFMKVVTPVIQGKSQKQELREANQKLRESLNASNL
ncbi:PilZ domain-containing protein [Deltaproteobacteria bacterium TL4]